MHALRCPVFLFPLLLTALTIVFRLSQRIPAIFICVQMKLSYVLFQLFLSFIIFCLLDLIICSKTTLNGWFRKPNAHEKHTGQNKRIVPKCTTALLIPEFFSISKLQETFTKNTLGKRKDSPKVHCSSFNSGILCPLKITRNVHHD